MRRCFKYHLPAGVRCHRPLRHGGGQRAETVQEIRQVQHAVGRDDQERRREAAEDGERVPDPGLERHPDNPGHDERQEDRHPGGVLRARGKSRRGAGPRKRAQRPPFFGPEGQQERQRHEERRRDVGQDVVRFPDVNRQRRQDSRCQQPLLHAPPAPGQVDHVDGGGAERGGQRPSPQVEVVIGDLRQRGPGAGRRAREEPRDDYAGLEVEIESRVVEEVRMEVAGFHHRQRPHHDLRFVHAERRRQAAAKVPESQRGRGRHDEDDRDGPVPGLAGLDRLVLGHLGPSLSVRLF